MAGLFCAIVGEERIIYINIDSQKAVGDLKKFITKEAQYEFPSYKLVLYLAKKSGDEIGEWMNDDDNDLIRLQKATLPKDMEKKYLKKELLLKPTSLIKTHFTEVPKEKVIHVLVDIRGRNHVSVASDKSSLLTGGRKCRGKNCGDLVEGMFIPSELLHSNYHKRMFTWLVQNRNRAVALSRVIHLLFHQLGRLYYRCSFWTRFREQRKMCEG
nr:crinkler 35 [Plasmopara viticola]